MGPTGDGETSCIDITGKNFTSTLKVWFGDCEAETICRSEENMIAVVPDRKLVQPDWDPKISAADKLSVPISLVRSDGVIFPHDKENFTYCPEPEASSEPSEKRIRLDLLKSSTPTQQTQPNQNTNPNAQTQQNPASSSFNPQDQFNNQSSNSAQQITYSTSQYNQMPSISDIGSAALGNNLDNGQGYGHPTYPNVGEMNQAAYLNAIAYQNQNILAQMKKESYNL